MLHLLHYSNGFINMKHIVRSETSDASSGDITLHLINGEKIEISLDENIEYEVSEQFDKACGWEPKKKEQ